MNEGDKPMKGSYKYDSGKERVSLRLRLDGDKMLSRHNLQRNAQLYVALVLGNLQLVCKANPALKVNIFCKFIS